MGKPRIFSTAPVAAMLDTELTGLDWRLLLWVSLHDGMSLTKGKGAGCFASNRTLFAEAQCDYASGCRSLSKLVSLGHLVREKTGRATSYRVVFPPADILQARNQSRAEHVAGSTYGQPEHVAEQSQQNDEKPSEHDGHYSPLSGELDSAEAEELNSSEEARDNRAHSNHLDIGHRSEGGKDQAEALAARGHSIDRQLTPHFAKLAPAAQLVRFEEAFAQIGRDPDRVESRERERWSQWLWSLSDDFAGEPVGHHAERLCGEWSIY